MIKEAIFEYVTQLLPTNIIAYFIDNDIAIKRNTGPYICYIIFLSDDSLDVYNNELDFIVDFNDPTSLDKLAQYIRITCDKINNNTFY